MNVNTTFKLGSLLCLIDICVFMPALGWFDCCRR